MQTTPRTGRDLLEATRPFASDDRLSSWWHVASTFALLTAATAVAAFSPHWPLRIAAAVVQALVLLRAFILYHDFMHGALLRGSRLAKALFYVHGVLMLTPPRFWSESHNTHHAQPARIERPPVGTFSLWTVQRWQSSTRLQRLAYVLERHPVTMLLAHVTVFFFGMGIIPFARNPRRYASSGLAVAVYLALSIAVWSFAGPWVYLLAFLGPRLLASAIGAYLFYSQHNFPEMQIADEPDWEYTAAAVEASSYLRTGRVMAWLTGNIGYHHVHHLSSRIPFYRLPEAMAALPELQNPGVTTLTPGNILACLRANLWDPSLGRPVPYPRRAHRKPVAAPVTVTATATIEPSPAG